MKYVGIQSQQRLNNQRSIALLLLFPLIIIGLVWTFIFIVLAAGDNETSIVEALQMASHATLKAMPFVGIVVLAWFFISYFANTSMVRHATGARPLQRRENPRVYNIVENLTMACGMDMPRVNVIDSPMLNAFASGIDRDSYTVTVTTGLCDTLTDRELEGVIGHELTHIRNNDTRLLIISIVFVGIMAVVVQITYRLLVESFFSSSRRSRSSNGKSGGGAIIVMLLALVVAAVGYVLTLLTRFAISRKREFMADAGGAELCGDPYALASALRKISSAPLEAPKGRDDIAQLYIHHAVDGKGMLSFFTGLFSTHPDINRRIQILEQF